MGGPAGAAAAGAPPAALPPAGAAPAGAPAPAAVRPPAAAPPAAAPAAARPPPPPPARAPCPSRIAFEVGCAYQRAERGKAALPPVWSPWSEPITMCVIGRGVISLILSTM